MWDKMMNDFTGINLPEKSFTHWLWSTFGSQAQNKMNNVLMHTNVESEMKKQQQKSW